MQMDDAMERRFHKKIHFRTPNEEERLEIIKHYLENVNEDLKGVINFNHFASITAGLSGAKIEGIIKEASLISIQEDKKIDTNIIFKAFEKITIGESSRELTKNQDENRDIIAIHELGHFICDYEQHVKAGLSILSSSTLSYIFSLNAFCFWVFLKFSLFVSPSKMASTFLLV
jgi:cell division protease FtsH